MTSDDNYDFKDVEEKWMDRWEEMGLYRFDRDSDRPVYSIDTPPRYASGYLHMGHAKNYLEFEMIARSRRLLGYNVYFPVGYDDNGLPTEKFVEEELGLSKRELDRVEFIERCREASEELEDQMTEVFKRIGMSWDWSTLYRTIDDRSVKTAQRSFLELYEDGELYRDKEPTIWCPYHNTALAQAEVEEIERKTKLNYLHFQLKDGKKIEIATTRPELLPSCVAVFVHPKDERYQDLIGKKAEVPLFGQEVSIIEGEEVDPDFGSGMVMVCTFGDNTDVEMWKKYDLPLRVSIDKEGRMKEEADEYEGLEIKEAQERIIEDLIEKEIIFKQEEIEQKVGACWRCDTPVEFIPTKQWFVKTLQYKDKLLELGDSLDWYPDYYKHRYEDWVKNLKWDWCISRQRYYGVPFPLWYCEECGEVRLADQEDLPVDPRRDEIGYSCENCGSSSLKPEMDVMDTWMTSSLTPQIGLNWVNDEEFFKEHFPMSMRPQSHDIIRTWAFYTILKSNFHHDSIPWEDIMVSGYVYTEEGVGMSSSKGTGVSPQKIIDEYGADCLRYWAAGAGIGEDIIYREKDVIRGQKILTKLWNASRLVKMHLEDYEEKEPELTTIDRWILSNTKKIVEECEALYRNYDISKVREIVTNFFKHKFCDNYLELIKYRLYEEEISKEDKQAALYTVHRSLLSILKVFSPIIPYVTEEIYNDLFKDIEQEKSIHVSDWPDIPSDLTDKKAEERGEFAKDIVAEVRKWKSDKGIPLNEEIGTLKLVMSPEKIEGCERDIIETVRATGLKLIQEEEVEERAGEILPDHSKLGPKYGERAKEIFDHLEKAEPEEVASEVREGSYTIELESGEEVQIKEEDLEIRPVKVHAGEEVESLNVDETLILVEK